MRTSEIRKEIHDYIDQADDRFLKLVHAMSKKYENSLIIGYTSKGEPITKTELQERVKAASKRVKSGDFISHEELEKEVENW
jgi:hypothetical protein